MKAKMEVNFVVMQFTHVPENNGAWSKKQKLKLRQNCFANVLSDFNKYFHIGRKCWLFYLMFSL